MTVYRWVTLERHHMEQIRVQPAQEQEARMQEDVMSPGWAMLADGRAIAACGTFTVWPGRGYAWALLDRDAGRHMVALTRAIRAELDRSTCWRVEMAVDAGFEQGVRFAYLLGFRLETPDPMRAFFPNGHDAFQFARINDELLSASLRGIRSGAEPEVAGVPV